MKLPRAWVFLLELFLLLLNEFPFLSLFTHVPPPPERDMGSVTHFPLISLTMQHHQAKKSFMYFLDNIYKTDVMRLDSCEIEINPRVFSVSSESEEKNLFPNVITMNFNSVFVRGARKDGRCV